MDIVVTIPKREYENDERETKDMAAHNLNAFWTLSRVPKRLQVGDRVYFVKYDEVESSMKVLDIRVDSELTCETTKREWRGKCQLVLTDLRTEKGERCKGFQGFRYRWW